MRGPFSFAEGSALSAEDLVIPGSNSADLLGFDADKLARQVAGNAALAFARLQEQHQFEQQQQHDQQQQTQSSQQSAGHLGDRRSPGPSQQFSPPPMQQQQQMGMGKMDLQELQQQQQQQSGGVSSPHQQLSNGQMVKDEDALVAHLQQQQILLQGPSQQSLSSISHRQMQQQLGHGQSNSQLNNMSTLSFQQQSNLISQQQQLLLQRAQNSGSPQAAAAALLLNRQESSSSPQLGTHAASLELLQHRKKLLLMHQQNRGQSPSLQQQAGGPSILVPPSAGTLSSTAPPALQDVPSQLDKVPEGGIGSRRLMQFMYHQRRRPPDNNIEFWRQFVAEYFAPGAKKRWCVSSYGNGGRQPAGVFPQDIWNCELCRANPGRGFEMTVEVLPRLFKIKYDSGLLDELLFVDSPKEFELPNGNQVLEYTNAIQESAFDGLRVVRTGHLRVVFNKEFKMLSWEFCTLNHEELIPRRLVLQQVSALANLAYKYQSQNVPQVSMQHLQTQCAAFATMSRQLALKLDAPTVNDLGFTKCYVRCLQISEVVNSMKDLIDFSKEHNLGPISSLMSFPRRTTGSPAAPSSSVQQQMQQASPSPPVQQETQAVLLQDPVASLGIAGISRSHSISPSASLTGPSGTVTASSLQSPPALSGGLQTGGMGVGNPAGVNGASLGGLGGNMGGGGGGGLGGGGMAGNLGSPLGNNNLGNSLGNSVGGGMGSNIMGNVGGGNLQRGNLQTGNISGQSIQGSLQNSNSIGGRGNAIGRDRKSVV